MYDFAASSATPLVLRVGSVVSCMLGTEHFYCASACASFFEIPCDMGIWRLRSRERERTKSTCIDAFSMTTRTDAGAYTFLLRVQGEVELSEPDGLEEGGICDIVSRSAVPSSGLACEWRLSAIHFTTPTSAHAVQTPHWCHGDTCTHTSQASHRLVPHH